MHSPPKVSACPICLGTDFKRRTVYKHQNMIAKEYDKPVVLKKFHQIVKTDPQGNVITQPIQDPATGKISNLPVMEYKDQVFNTRKEQDEWMDRHGWCRLADAEGDSTFHESQSELYGPGAQGQAMPSGIDVIKLGRIEDGMMIFDEDQVSEHFGRDIVSNQGGESTRMM